MLARQCGSAEESAKLLLRMRYLAPATSMSDAAFDAASTGQMFQLTKHARERARLAAVTNTMTMRKSVML